MKRALIFLSILLLSGFWQIGKPFDKLAVQKELEEFRAEYENAVRQRNADSVLSFYDDQLRSEMQDYWKFLLAGGWGRMSFLDEQQAEYYSSFRLLMAICKAGESEATAVLAHDTGYPFINRYFLVSKYGPDVYRLVKKEGRWRISGRVGPSDLYDVQHHDLQVQVFPDTGEIAVKQTIIAKRVAGDGRLFISWIHEGMKIGSIESPQGALDFKQLASTVAVQFKEKPTSDTIQLDVSYKGKAGEWFVNRNFPKGTYVNGQRIEPHLAIVRQENSWHLQTNPATARLAITAPKGYRPLSSHGVLTSSEEGNGTATYIWEMNTPVPQFEFLACDNWNIHSKKVGELTISVYLREGNKSDPEEIAKNTEEILLAFNELFGPTLPYSFALVDMPFGWNRPNYVPLFGGGQVSVHEMAHYWWTGAFKSTEKRAFDWFTEGFATCSEALYEEYNKKNVGAYYEFKWRNIWGYLMSQDNKIDPGDQSKTLLKVPDSPTRYQKGACVLHALRFVVGDEQFFKILKTFVETYRGMDISLEKFRRVSEDIYGKDLKWFFDEWLERAGLPEYRLTVGPTEATGSGEYKVTGRIEQLSELYRMPLEVVVSMEGSRKSERVWVEGQNTTFEMIVPQKPLFVELDPSPWVIRYDIKESPAYKVEEFVLTRKNGQKSSEEIAGRYSKEWLEIAKDRATLKRIGYALYDAQKYEEALAVFNKVTALEAALKDLPNNALALIWQGHVLDLLGRREEALSLYQKVVDMNITDSQWSSGMYGLAYKPSISGYAAERIRERFKRLGNRKRD